MLNTTTLFNPHFSQDFGKHLDTMKNKPYYKKMKINFK